MDNESNLIQRLRSPKHKDAAFSELLDLYQERLYWHIRKLVLTHENADDVLQNTFVRVYRGIENFKEKSSLHTWMFRIAYNESMRFLEKEKKRSATSIDDVVMSQFQELKESAYFDGEALQVHLQEIILQLSEKQRKVFQMKYFDDLSFRQISEVLQVTESTLKSSYYTAVKIIEEKIITKTNY